MAAERMRQRLMNNTELYDPTMMGRARHTYGHIPGISIGTYFATRQECMDAGVHKARTAGISGGVSGAESIVISSGYEDDFDAGYTITYTGTGGHDTSFSNKNPNVQTEDQTFEHPHNAALFKSVSSGLPVRVTRGPNKKSKWAPPKEKGFRYDGLYIVKQAYYDKGKHGFKICRFELERLADQGVDNDPGVPSTNPEYIGIPHYR